MYYNKLTHEYLANKNQRRFPEMKNNMSNPQTANNDAKQSFFVRLSAKIKSLIKANKVEKTNTKAVHARNRAESKILIKAKPVLMAIKWMFKKVN